MTDRVRIVILMPTTGNIDPTLGEQIWKSAFSHDGEVVQPCYHRLFLQDYGIWVEQTVTDRVSFYRLRYTKDAVADLLLNLGGYVSTASMTDCRVTKVSNTVVEGSVNTTGRLWGGSDNVRVFFVMHVDKPFEQLNGYVSKERQTDITTLQGLDVKPPSRDYPDYMQRERVSKVTKNTVQKVQTLPKTPMVLPIFISIIPMPFG